MTAQDDRFDPVQFKYERAEKIDEWADRLAVAAAAVFGLGLAAGYLESDLAELAKYIFIACTVAGFVLAYYSRYGSSYSADRERSDMLLCDGLGIAYRGGVHKNYYNNAMPPSLDRILANLCENTFYYPRLLAAELRPLIVLTVIFTILLLISIKTSSVEAVELCAIVILFSEFLVGKLLRLLWLKSRYENCHERIVALLRLKASNKRERFKNIILLLVEYESLKSRAMYRPKTSTFFRLNPILSNEWEAYRDRVYRP